ncbi:hypothetical protein [Streptomyces fumanus]|uniref:hypothetical protein n=1 Tax=Streptomyces fumanus TaxID=67302 RepID=UPI0033C2C7A1
MARSARVLTGATGAGALLLGLAGGQGGAGPLWLVAAAAAATAVLLGRSAFRALATVDLARLARESARASQAQTYVLTGTLHHALDLYRPEPRGFTSAPLRQDGRLRGYATQGAVRALRTPGRAAAAVLLLLTGGAVLTAGTARADGSTASTLWIAGAVCLYLGSSWIGETWRGLRDELTLAPLLGQWWGGAAARALTWPVLAVTAGACLGGGLAVLVGRPVYDGRPAQTALFVAGTAVLVLGARFLREMKTHLPLSLLLPIITPFGDLSALMLVAWQFDGFVVLLAGVAVVNAVPSAPGAAAVAALLTACCVWAGLRRTGWAHRGLLHRLRRA